MLFVPPPTLIYLQKNGVPLPCLLLGTTVLFAGKTTCTPTIELPGEFTFFIRTYWTNFKNNEPGTHNFLNFSYHLVIFAQNTKKNCKFLAAGVNFLISG